MAPEQIQLANLIGGLSLAVDLAEGKPLQHARDVTYLALSIGESLDLPTSELDVLYFAGLLHDITFTSEGEFCPLCTTAREYGLAHLIPVLLEADKAIHHSHEFWDGSGPLGLSGQAIPLTARILAMAIAVDRITADKRNFWNWRLEVQELLSQSKGKWHDPSFVQQVMTLLQDQQFSLGLFGPTRNRFIEKYLPTANIPANGIVLEILGKSFAPFIDQKTPYTANHSWDVANVALRLAEKAGLPEATARNIYIASLLHDLGKITIPNSILEKAGPLSQQEFNIIKNHPYYSALILDQIPELETISFWASAHHEKLDGSGYYLGSTRETLPLEARLIAVSDVYAALAADRPYRKGMDRVGIENTLYQLKKNGHLDGQYVDMVLSLTGEQQKEILGRKG